MWVTEAWREVRILCINVEVQNFFWVILSNFWVMYPPPHQWRHCINVRQSRAMTLSHLAVAPCGKPGCCEISATAHQSISTGSFWLHSPFSFIALWMKWYGGQYLFPAGCGVSVKDEILALNPTCFKSSQSFFNARHLLSTWPCTRLRALIHIRVWNWPQALEAQWGLFVPGEMQRATHTSADLGGSVDNKISRLVSSCDSTSVLRCYLIRVFRITMIRRVDLFGLLISFVSSAGGSLSFSLLVHFVPPICQVLFFSAASVSQWLLLRVSEAARPILTDLKRHPIFRLC